jgi:hypothetical protein
MVIKMKRITAGKIFGAVLAALLAGAVIITPAATYFAISAVKAEREAEERKAYEREMRHEARVAHDMALEDARRNGIKTTQPIPTMDGGAIPAGTKLTFIMESGDNVAVQYAGVQFNVPKSATTLGATQ